MPPFSFAEWYARMGYHRHGGQKACAEALGITPSYIRMLLKDKKKPSATLAKLCKVVEATLAFRAGMI